MEKTIGTQIKKIRNKNKLSQRRFGFKIGLSGKTISAYETGKCYPPLKVLEKIANTYEVAFTHTNRQSVTEKIQKVEQQIAELKNLILELD